MRDVGERAREEFEVVTEDLALGTNKFYTREDFLEYGDDRGIDEGDFIGRLRALFGPVARDMYVLRHRDTGSIVTADVMQGGPSYGGGPGLDPTASPQEAAMFVGRLLQDSQAQLDRIHEDPELAAGLPSRRPGSKPRRAGDRERLRELDHRWRRQMADASTPPAIAGAIARLAELVEQAQPVDWDAHRYSSDVIGVSRLGVHHGASYDLPIGIEGSLEVLLDYAERGDRSMADTAGSPFDDPDLRVVEYWIDAHRMVHGPWDDDDDDDDEGEDDEDEEYDEEAERIAMEEILEEEAAFFGDGDGDDEVDDDEAFVRQMAANDDGKYPTEEDRRAAEVNALEQSRPRVQEAWFRGVTRLSTYSPEVRAALADIARGQIEVLQIDAAKADAAIRAGSNG